MENRIQFRIGKAINWKGMPLRGRLSGDVFVTNYGASDRRFA